MKNPCELFSCQWGARYTVVQPGQPPVLICPPAPHSEGITSRQVVADCSGQVWQCSLNTSWMQASAGRSTFEQSNLGTLRLTSGDNLGSRATAAVSGLLVQSAFIWKTDNSYLGQDFLSYVPVIVYALRTNRLSSDDDLANLCKHISAYKCG